MVLRELVRFLAKVVNDDPEPLLCVLNLTIYALPMEELFPSKLETDCTDFYRPQRSSEGYVFTGVCLSRGGIPACLTAGFFWGGGWYPSMPCRWYPSMTSSRSWEGGIPA